MKIDKLTRFQVTASRKQITSVFLLAVMGATPSVRAVEPDPGDLVHVATKIEANLQKLKSLRGRYRLDYRSSPGEHYAKWNSQPVKFLLHDVVIDFAISIAEKPILMATFDRLTDDVVELESGKRVTVPKTRLSFISILKDGDYRYCQIAHTVDPTTGKRKPGSQRVVQIDDRSRGERSLDVTNPLKFYHGPSDDLPEWLRGIAETDSERSKFTMVKEGPLWKLSFTAKTPYGDDVVLTSVFDARSGFNAVDMHETILGKTRNRRQVRYDIKDGVYVPSEITTDSYTFDIEFQDSCRYTLESIEVNPKLTEDDFGFAPFELINGDTIYDRRTRTRKWHWDGEFISKEEFERRWKASQKGSSVQVSRPGSRVAMVACTCILAIAASSLLWRRKSKDMH